MSFLEWTELRYLDSFAHGNHINVSLKISKFAKSYRYNDGHLYLWLDSNIETKVFIPSDVKDVADLGQGPFNLHFILNIITSILLSSSSQTDSRAIRLAAQIAVSMFLRRRLAEERNVIG